MEISEVQNNRIGKYTSVGKVDSSEKVKQPQENNNSDYTGTIKGSELNLTGQQDTGLKKLLAQKAAWQMQLDEFGKDAKMDEVITGHESSRAAYKEEALANQKEVSRLSNLTKDAKESYGVEDDSTEQKDLELMQKQMTGKAPLSAEELSRLAEMGPLTQYQKVAMDYTSMAIVFQTRADKAINNSINESGTITAIKLELLKSQPMIEAKKEAEEMMKQVDDQIQLALIEELKNKVNEKLNIDPNKSILTDPGALVDQKQVTEEDLKGLVVDEKL